MQRLIEPICEDNDIEMQLIPLNAEEAAPSYLQMQCHFNYLHQKISDESEFYKKNMLIGMAMSALLTTFVAIYYLQHANADNKNLLRIPISAGAIAIALFIGLRVRVSNNPLTIANEEDKKVIMGMHRTICQFHEPEVNVAFTSLATKFSITDKRFALMNGKYDSHSSVFSFFKQIDKQKEKPVLEHIFRHAGLG